MAPPTGRRVNVMPPFYELSNRKTGFLVQTESHGLLNCLSPDFDQSPDINVQALFASCESEGRSSQMQPNVSRVLNFPGEDLRLRTEVDA